MHTLGTLQAFRLRRMTRRARRDISHLQRTGPPKGDAWGLGFLFRSRTEAAARSFADALPPGLWPYAVVEDRWLMTTRWQVAVWADRPSGDWQALPWIDPLMRHAIAHDVAFHACVPLPPAPGA